MADTVKKSRIVSENECFSVFDDSEAVEDDSLQDIINQEFNQRLKTCMIEKTDNEVCFHFCFPKIGDEPGFKICHLSNFRVCL